MTAHKRKLLFLFFTLIFLPVLAFAQKEPLVTEDSEDEKQPLKVTSERMISDKKNNIITFFGSVVATKGNLKVVADKIKIFTEEDGGDFRELEATGSVEITHKDKIARGQQANYYPDKKMIVLTGSPELFRGSDWAAGEKVIYYFDREDMEIIGGKEKRSTVILYPAKNGKSKKPVPAVEGKNELPSAQPKVAKQATPEVEKQAVPDSAGKKRLYTIQIGSYSDKKEASDLRKQTSSKGYNSYVKEFEKNGKTWYRVRIGQFRTSGAAKRMAGDITEKENLPTIVLPY